MTIDEATLQQVVEFHGHLCPGLAMGVQAAEIALREIGPHAQDEEVVAVTETDMCGVDAIQFLTGCTYRQGQPHPPGRRKERVHVLPALRWQGDPHCQQAGRLAAGSRGRGAVRQGALR